MASKLISALAATALIAAVPSVAFAQDDDDGISTEVALGVIFTLLAGVILFWEGDEEPLSA